MTENRIAAVVLAAGASERMGRCKAELELDGRSFLAHAVAQAEAACCDPIVVVVGAHPGLRPPAGALRVDNPRWREGPSSSLWAGLGEVVARVGTAVPVLVLTVDRPHVRPATLEALAAAARAEPDRVIRPAREGVAGHPLVVPAALVTELLALGGGPSLREVLRRAPWSDLRSTVEVDDSAVLDNLDRPEDLERLGRAIVGR